MNVTEMKTSLQIFRDCMRLVRHIAGNTPKGDKLAKIVKNEFRKNANETDPQKIHELKFNAIRALSNYLLYEASLKDDKIKERIEKR